MFESDDFDEVLSQFDFNDIPTKTVPKLPKENLSILKKISQDSDVIGPTLPDEEIRVNFSNVNKVTPCENLNIIPTTVQDVKQATLKKNDCINNIQNENLMSDMALKDTRSHNLNENSSNVLEKKKHIPISTSKRICVEEVSTIKRNGISNTISPKHTKRKIINSLFDHNSKRKFPGPAGLLVGSLQENKDDNICQMELLSQDIDYTQHILCKDVFESPLWKRLLDDVNNWNLRGVDQIKTIKEQSLVGSLRKRKAQTVIAFVETIDRSVIDPLITLRDTTGNIKCTLHRDAWLNFSPYIVSNCCALILKKPTILTTGSAFKKHYLNITLSNIYAIYSATLLNEESENVQLPDGYIMLNNDDFTVIKSEIVADNLDANSSEVTNETNGLLDDLDNMFSDDIF